RDRRAPGRRRGRPPDIALLARQGRCRGGGPSPRRGRAHRLVAGPWWAAPRKRPPDTRPHAPRPAPARGRRRPRAPAALGERPCRPRLDTRAAHGSGVVGPPHAPRLSGPPDATRARYVRHDPLYRRAPPPRAAPRSPA